MHTLARRCHPVLAAALVAAALAGVTGCSGASSATGAPPQSLGATPSQGGAVAAGTAAPAATGAAPTGPVAPAIPGSSLPPVTPAASENHGTGQGVSVLGIETKPGCDPTLFVNRAGPVGGALTTFLFTPQAKGTLNAAGTKGAVAVLHAGQAVRFGAAHLAYARQALAACPKAAAALIKALTVEVARLRAADVTFGTNKVPSKATIGELRSGQVAVVTEAKKVKIIIVDVVPSLTQVAAG